MRGYETMLLVASLLCCSLTAGAQTDDRQNTGNVDRDVDRQNDYISLELLEEPVTVNSGETVIVGSFTVLEARLIGLRLQLADSDPMQCTVHGAFEWRWMPTDSWFPHTTNDHRLPPLGGGGIIRPLRASVYVSGDGSLHEAPLLIFPQGPYGRVVLGAYSDCSLTVGSVRVVMRR